MTRIDADVEQAQGGENPPLRHAHGIRGAMAELVAGAVFAGYQIEESPVRAGWASSTGRPRSRSRVPSR